MMEIEKRFAVTDLSQFKTVPEELFAKVVIQYQDYKTDIAVSKIDYKNLLGWTFETAKTVFINARRYLLTKNKDALKNNASIRKAIDKVKSMNRYMALTPTFKERRVERKRRHVTITPIVQKEEVKEVEPKPVLYAIQNDNIFYTFKNKEDIDTFVQGVKFADKDKELKICKISLLDEK